MADLLFILFGFSCFAYVEIETALLVWSNPNQLKRGSAMQWYSPLWWLFSGSTKALIWPFVRPRWDIWTEIIFRVNGIPGKGSNGRQDSIRSGYLSDHETKAGTIVHQQISVDSIRSQDSRLCYLTSSEVNDLFFKKMGQSRPLFVYFHHFLITISIIQIEKA